MRRLIVNADDFGMTRGVNRAIVEAMGHGIVTSTTLMATARAFDDAVTSVRQFGPGVSIGCHVILLDGTPVSPSERISSLLQPSSDQNAPEFRVKLGDFARAALSGRLDPKQVEAEAVAQVSRLQDAGINVSHVDCHKHAHMFPAVLKPLLRAAKSRGVSAVRNPFGRIFPLLFGRILRNPKMWRRASELGVLSNFGRRFKREVENYGLRTPDGSVGVLDTGTLDLDSFLTIAGTLGEGTWEFVCHPGYSDSDLDQVRTRLRQSREQELALLTSPSAKAALEKQGVELISYHDL